MHIHNRVRVGANERGECANASRVVIPPTRRIRFSSFSVSSFAPGAKIAAEKNRESTAGLTNGAYTGARFCGWQIVARRRIYLLIDRSSRREKTEAAENRWAKLGEHFWQNRFGNFFLDLFLNTK